MEDCLETAGAAGMSLDTDYAQRQVDSSNPGALLIVVKPGCLSQVEGVQQTPVEKKINKSD